MSRELSGNSIFKELFTGSASKILLYVGLVQDISSRVKVSFEFGV